MDVNLLCRLQFAMTVGFHFFFPPITIGLAWLLVIVETLAWKSGLEVYDRMGRWFGKLLAITFAVGVATGIPMEFQFGMNWSRYSSFVGDIFGAPLAAEGVLAFFLESGFLGLYLFGRKRVSKGWHVFAIFMVAIGSTISAFWILAANSWMQTPAGYTINNGRAELTSFSEAIFNPSMWPRFGHTVMACLVAGAFFMAGIAAFLLRRNPDDDLARRALKISIPFGLVASILVAFPFGDAQARLVAHMQPEKFAALEGLYTSQTDAPLVMFAVPRAKPEPHLKGKIELPSMLSWLAFGNAKAEVRGLDAFSPQDRPPTWLTFVSFHNMVVLGLWFTFILALSSLQLWRGKLWTSRTILRALVWTIPFPLFACQLGWMAAEVGRQPWAVYHVFRTADAHSPNLVAGELLFSLILFALIYVLLGSLYLYLVISKVRHGPDRKIELPKPTSRDPEKEMVTA